MELEQKLNEGMKAFETFTTEIKSKMDKLDGLDKEKFSKLESSMADAIAEQQKKDSSIAALENQVKAMEAAIARPNMGSDAESKESEKKTSELFGEFMRKGAGSERSDFADFVARKGVELKAISVGINPDGGYLAPATLGGLIDVRVFETSPIRQFANIVTISGAEYEVVLDNDEAASGWVSETASRPVTNTPTLDKRIIPTHELYANPTATQKLIDDAAVNMEAWLAGKVASKFGRDEATAFASGNGVGKPTGILTYTTTSTSYSPRNVQVINSGTQGAFTYAGLANLQNALKEPYQSNARFLMKRTSFGAVINIKTGISGDNRPIFNMMYDKNAGLAFSILGAPVSFADDVPAVANDVNAAIYGDLRQAYTIVDRIGLRVLRDPYSSKPYIQYYTTKRVGGDVVNAEAVKILALSA